MTAELMVAAREIATKLAGRTRAEWATITLQMSFHQNGYTAKEVTDAAGGLAYGYMDLGPLHELVRAASGVRSGLVQLTVRSSGDFELSHTAGQDVRLPPTQMVDSEFRLPGHPRPGMPLPAAARLTDEPTDPGVLAEISALVDEFAARYGEIKGSPPPWKPGVTETEIAAAEARLGARLPEDLRALYRKVGGDPEETGLLGVYSTLPLEQVVEHYSDGERGSLGWYDEPFDNNGVVFDSDPPRHVKRVSRNDWWITFASDFSMNYLAVDLDPAEHGNTGQIFEYGRDIYGPVRYVATSVTTMLTEVLGELRAGRYDAAAASEEDEDEEDEEVVHLRTVPRFVNTTEVRPHCEVLNDVGDRDLAAVVAGFDHPELVQQLFVNDATDLDLSALAPLNGLRELAINRATSVRPRLRELASLEALRITADRVELADLAGHPCLWDLSLSGSTVAISPLRTVQNLVRLDLSAAEVTDLEHVAELPGLRVLMLNAVQWKHLRAAGRVPTGLAPLACTGIAPLTDVAEWERGFGREVDVHTLTGSFQ